MRAEGRPRRGICRTIESGSMTRWGRALFALLIACTLGACATLRQFAPVVKQEPMTPAETIALQRGDLLTTNRLSASTMQTIRVAVLDEDACATSTLAPDCIPALALAKGIGDERLLSALSELWLQQALARVKAKADDEAILGAWMEAARYAYAYLFFTRRAPGERAFEDRQTQVRDWYNYAVQEAITRIFAAGMRARQTGELEENDDGHFVRAGWTFRMDLSGIRLPENAKTPRELIPASSLAFKGMRSTWRRDGFGAELVAVMAQDPVTAATHASADEVVIDKAHPRRRIPAWSEMPSPNLTVLFRFAGNDLASVLATHEVHASAHDPYVQDAVVLRNQTVPLAANFSAGYGLWLARSGFNRQSLRTLFGRDHGIDRPHLYMMQPYDPQRRVILMLHGLASSPEAWANVANELQGDAELRKNFQIWQVYYPTNAPVVLNHAAIRRLVARTLQHFDPSGQAPASRDMVLIGHSMGGVIARLMVSSADQQLWAWAMRELELEPKRVEKLRPRLDAILRFEPMPQFERVIFIATPHRGTVVAGKRMGRWVSRLVRLPLTLLKNFAEILQITPEAKAADSAQEGPPKLPNSIDNLDEHDPFVLAADDLPISPRVRYHSIIARADASVPLEESDDGLVPYRSAHLSGALSEKVITSAHSVQGSASSILELRRILHMDLAEHGILSQ